MQNWNWLWESGSRSRSLFILMSSEVSLLLLLHYTGSHLEFTQSTEWPWWILQWYINAIRTESVLSLIKKASYLADKGQVTFGCNLKHFPTVRFEVRKTEKGRISVGISQKCWRRKRMWRAITAGIVLHRACFGFSWYTGTNCAVCGCLFITVRVDGDLYGKGIG